MDEQPPDLIEQIAETLRKDMLSFARLEEVKRRHNARRAGKSDQPVEPDPPPDIKP